MPKINDTDYESCNITFDDKGNAKVTIVGKGKFEGMAVCNANKNSASISSDCSTDASYFEYIDAIDEVFVKDKDKCKTYMINSLGAPEEDAIILCNGSVLSDGYSLLEAVSFGEIASSDYETAGLEVTYNGGICIIRYNSGFNVEVKEKDKCITYLSKRFSQNSANNLCTKQELSHYVSIGTVPLSDCETAGLEVTYKNGGGPNVIIPESINGKKVTDISSLSSSGIVSVIIPNTIINIGEDAFKYNLLTTVTIPDSVTSIGKSAFEGNNLTNVTIPGSVTSIGAYAFEGNNLTNVTIPASVTSIGKGAFRIGCARTSVSLGVCTQVSGNENLSKIINKTGKSFDWDAIINDPLSGSYTFETGTVASYNKANWNIKITK